MYLTGLVIVVILLLGFMIYLGDELDPREDITYGSILFNIIVIAGSWVSVILISLLVFVNYIDWIEDQLPESIWEFLDTKPFNKKTK